MSKKEVDAKSSGKTWTITLNNYTEEEEKHLKSLKKSYLFYGKEIGDEGTPHLQGFITFNNNHRLSSLKKINPRIHWEYTTHKEAAINYCNKVYTEKYEEDNRYKKEEPKGLPVCPLPTWKLHEWEKQIISIIESEPDDRTIHWVHDTKGLSGKSQFCKYLFIKYGTLVINGNITNAFHLIATYIQTKKEFPRSIMVDIPRSEFKFVSYGALEAIKTGLFYSGKYEGFMVCMPSPHLLIFSNYYLPPDIYSADRLNLIELDDYASKVKDQNGKGDSVSSSIYETQPKDLAPES